MTIPIGEAPSKLIESINHLVGYTGLDDVYLRASGITTEWPRQLNFLHTIAVNAHADELAFTILQILGKPRLTSKRMVGHAHRTLGLYLNNRKLCLPVAEFFTTFVENCTNYPKFDQSTTYQVLLGTGATTTAAWTVGPFLKGYGQDPFSYLESAIYEPDQQYPNLKYWPYPVPDFSLPDVLDPISGTVTSSKEKSVKIANRIQAAKLVTHFIAGKLNLA